MEFCICSKFYCTACDVSNVCSACATNSSLNGSQICECDIYYVLSEDKLSCYYLGPGDVVISIILMDIYDDGWNG